MAKIKSQRLIERWAEDAKIRGISPSTVYGYRRILKNFEKFAQGADLLQADKFLIRDYIKELQARGLLIKTIEYHLLALSNLYRWARFEELIKEDPLAGVREHYLRRYKGAACERHTHKLISVAEATHLVDSFVDIRDKAMIMLLLKTGMRRGELLSLDLDDINWKNQSITLKPVAKRTNRVVFFDDETARILRRWLVVRQERSRSKESSSLWISTQGSQATRGWVDYQIEKAAILCGLHDPSSQKMEDHFSAHCCRHWFTTHLRRAGMPREFIQELRGDVRKEAIDIYDHIDKEELRKSYLAHIPQLGV